MRGEGDGRRLLEAEMVPLGSATPARDSNRGTARGFCVAAKSNNGWRDLSLLEDRSRDWGLSRSSFVVAGGGVEDRDPALDDLGAPKYIVVDHNFCFTLVMIGAAFRSLQCLNFASEDVYDSSANVGKHNVSTYSETVNVVFPVGDMLES